MLIDALGAFFDLLSTWYFIRLNSKAWPTGLIATAINGYLYWRQGIYADMVLSYLYCVNFSYGWYYWNKPKTHSQRKPLYKLSSFQWGGLVLLSTSLFLCTYLLLQKWTPSNVPLLDSATTSLSIIAQWLMYHKIIFTWILWVITDVLYIFMYLVKEMPYYALLMVIYTVMAIVGYYLWQKNDNKACPLQNRSELSEF
jgi:nicotinamide mononucleotide transporter